MMMIFIAIEVFNQVINLQKETPGNSVELTWSPVKVVNSNQIYVCRFLYRLEHYNKLQCSSPGYYLDLHAYLKTSVTTCQCCQLALPEIKIWHICGPLGMNFFVLAHFRDLAYSSDLIGISIGVFKVKIELWYVAPESRQIWNGLIMGKEHS